MPTTAIPTLSPDTGLGSDISVSDLGRILAGEEIAAPAAVPAPKPATQPVTTPEKPVEATPGTEAAAAEPTAAEPGDKSEAEGTTAETNQEIEQPEGRKKWWDKRLSTMAHSRDEARVIAENERKRAEQLQRKLEALEAQPGPSQPAAAAPAAAAPAKPQLATYVSELKDGEAYELAVERYTAAVLDAREVEQTAKSRRQQQAEAQQSQQEIFQKDWQEAVTVHPDFEDVVARVRANSPDGLQVAISQLRHDDGKAQWPTMLMYLDEHPDQLEALKKQYATNPIAATARLGRIAAQFEKSPATAAQKEKPPAKAAPRPPKAVAGTAAPGPIDLEKAPMDVFAREVVKYL